MGDICIMIKHRIYPDISNGNRFILITFCLVEDRIRQYNFFFFLSSAIIIFSKDNREYERDIACMLFSLGVLVINQMSN